MSTDWTVISAREPDQEILTACLTTIYPDMYMRMYGDGLAMELLDDPSAEPLLAVELPRLVRVTGEVTRLLRGYDVSVVAEVALPAALGGTEPTQGGRGNGTDECWWTEIHAVSAAAPARAHEVLDLLCHTLAANTAGAVLLPEGRA